MKKLFFITILSLIFSLSFAQGIYRDAFSNDAGAPSSPYWSNGNNTGYAVTHQAGSGVVTITKGTGGYPFAAALYLPYDNPEMSGSGNLLSSIDMSNNNDTVFVIAKSNVNGTLLRIIIEDVNNKFSTNYTSSIDQDILINQHALTTSYTLIKYPFKVVKDFFSSFGCSPEFPCSLDKSAITQFIFSINPENPNATAMVDIDYFQVGGTAPACPGGPGNLPTADAGPNVTVCPETPLATFNGNATNASYTFWNSIDNGNFSAPGSLSTTYTDGEYFNIAAMVLDVYSANGCSASDIALYIIKTQIADAGDDQFLLCGTASVSLNGSVTGAPISTWSGGTGTFSPDATMLNASYTPSQAEIIAGTVTLTLTTSGGTCNAVNNSMTITITPTVDAGSTQTLTCGNNYVTLQGDIEGAPGGIWSGGTGTFAPNTTDLNATYTPSFSEITAGVVVLTLTSTGTDCLQTSDALAILINSCTDIISSSKKHDVFFSTFPNPSNGTFTVQLDTEENYSAMKLEVINTLGEITFSKNIDSSSINISGLSKGLYTIKLFKNDGQYQLKKIIVE
jgi:hypothetical protein